MKYLCLILIIASLFLSSCSTVKKSAGVTRKSLDEFKVVENPPLVIPPDFNLLPPEQLEKNNIDNVETELAREILFGLDENLENNSEFGLSGFSALPGSGRSNGSGNYELKGIFAFFWTSSEGNSGHAWHRTLDYYYSNVYRYGHDRQYGFSVRCLGD